MKKVIIIGASSGIGKSLATSYLQMGFSVGITGRREIELNEIAKAYPDSCFVHVFDVTQEDSNDALKNLFKRMGRVDIVIVNSGIGNWNPKNEVQIDIDTINVNVVGFTRMAMTAFELLLKQGEGHLVGVSSIASYFGYGKAAAYNASKAYVANFLSGLQHRAKLSKKKIFVTDVQPGFIQTPMIENRKEPFGIISSDRFAELMIRKLESHPRKIILPFRWRPITWLLKLIPDSVIQAFS